MVLIIPVPQAFNFTGGVFQRVQFLTNDCFSVPQPSDLKCLDFSIANYNKTNDVIDFASISPNLVWTDNTSCTGNITERIAKTYGFPVVGDITATGTVKATGFITAIQLSFYLKKSPSKPIKRADPGVICRLPYTSICGPNAPKLNTSAYPPFAFSVIRELSLFKKDQLNIDFLYNPDNDQGGYSVSDMANAYSVEASTIVYKFINALTFSLTVPSQADDLSANNSCVYTYHSFVLSETKGLNYTLTNISQGTIPLKENANLTDGCLSGLVDIGAYTDNALIGQFGFTPTKECGGTVNYNDRFSRYFDMGTYYVNFYIVNERVIQFNVSENWNFGNYYKPGRRDGLIDWSFTFVGNRVDKATTSTAVTSTLASTISSTSSSTASTVYSSVVLTSSVTFSTVSGAVQSAYASGSTATATTVPVVIATTAGAAVPTAYVAPAVPSYGAPANNNLYKGAAVEKAGIVAGIISAFVLA
ncbi:hypothetical protein HDU79_009218 [Rhizoclosmatium sp. JEL0117]|nr:hypothetical protein HDU79_009218 [Rhizoclosmatium sp. JEL0117]